MKIILAFAGMISLAVIANLLMKTGAVMGRDGGGSWLEQVANWRIALGLVSFGLAAMLYVFVLRSLPLNVAQSFAAAQFVAVILASAFILSEPIGTVQWVGIILIASGIAIVGWTQG
ncbi:EamA family transporter [Usitatibacter palustris]|uniref:4-amino-4-deoxy-L-arabinose-phosphoundecaprenol flippase subunit ArnE n=1 Tax=Usitatibacter palustris TaxID=2732487 RepID=A0A6M4H9Q5_9PROT|nr:EamA family transporter [Usitatibacter palustris]QJR16499.1 4-amino-4-deoxy-L-arabinose-phosphoundecaprenol flippase subunit ArnE [Usitatibacter palustris]